MPSFIYLSLSGFALVTLLTACGDFLTDGATRIAGDIETGASALAHSSSDRHLIRHVPKAEPEGCSGAYAVQVSAASVILIWCKDASGKITSSHSTTYHLNFVDVPQTWNLEKAAGETLLIELEKHEGKPLVVGVR